MRHDGMRASRSAPASTSTFDIVPGHPAAAWSETSAVTWSSSVATVSDVDAASTDARPKRSSAFTWKVCAPDADHAYVYDVAATPDATSCPSSHESPTR